MKLSILWELLKTSVCSLFRELFVVEPEVVVSRSPNVPDRDLAGITVFFYGESYSTRGRIYGGPYVRKPDDIDGVKMAVEINKPCVIDIPTADFSVPELQVFEDGLLGGLKLLHDKSELYAGCMGGIGRTGLFMAGMKILEAFNKDIDIDEVTEDMINDAITEIRNPCMFSSGCVFQQSALYGVLLWL
jgi:hypothetical protein